MNRKIKQGLLTGLSRAFFHLFLEILVTELVDVFRLLFDDRLGVVLENRSEIFGDLDLIGMKDPQRVRHTFVRHRVYLLCLFACVSLGKRRLAGDAFIFPRETERLSFPFSFLFSKTKDRPLPDEKRKKSNRRRAGRDEWERVVTQRRG